MRPYLLPHMSKKSYCNLMLVAITFGLFTFYILALHSSIAGMSIFSSLLFLVSLIVSCTNKSSIKTPFDLPILIFLGAILINFIATPSELPWMNRCEELVWVFTFWGIFNSLRLIWSQNDYKKKSLYIWVGAFSITCIYGTLQFFSGIDIIRESPDHLKIAGGAYRSAGFYSSSLTYAYCLGLSGLSLLLPSAKIKKVMPILIFFLASLAVFTSQARGGWLALAVTILLLIILLKNQLSKKQLGLASIAMLIPFLVLVSTKGGQERVNLLFASKLDESSSIRIDLWKAYFQMFLDHPILGVGYQQGRDLLPQYYAKLGITQDFISHAHNDYIQMLGETGIIGFASFIFLIGYVMRKTYSLRKTNPEWALSLLAGQVFIFIGSLTQANFTDAEVNHFLMFNWALVSVLLVKQKEKALKN